MKGSLLVALNDMQTNVTGFLKDSDPNVIFLLFVIGAIILVVLLIISFILAFRIGSRMGKKSKEKELEAKVEATSKEFDSKIRETMGEISIFKKALSEFFDNKSGDIYKENEELKYKLEVMEKNLKRFQEKVGSSLGIMGFGSGKKAQLLADLMLENQLLEERLYQMNTQMKEERDKMLERDLQNISYKKVMFSKFLESEEAREQFKRFIQDEKNLEARKSMQELPDKTE